MSTQAQKEDALYRQVARMKRRCRPGHLSAEEHHLRLHRQANEHNLRVEGHLSLERRVWQKMLSVLERPQPSFLSRLFGRGK